MLNFADAMASGLTILIALIIAILSTGIRKYALGKVEGGDRIALSFLSDETLTKIFLYWSYFNRAMFTIFIFCAVFAGMRFINPPEQPIPNAVVKEATTQEHKKIPTPEAKVVQPTLDQATFYYCLDKASTKREGISADVIVACKDAALHNVKTTPIEKTAGYI